MRIRRKERGRRALARADEGQPEQTRGEALQSSITRRVMALLYAAAFVLVAPIMACEAKVDEDAVAISYSEKTLSFPKENVYS